MVKIGKLWGNAGFARLEPYSKLLYFYLITQPSISTLGVLELDKNKILLETSLKGIDYSFALKELRDGGYVHYLNDDRFEVFVIKEHFLSLSKSKLNVRKAKDEGRSSPYRDILLKIYDNSDFQPPQLFVPPTPEEVTEYALSKGYVVNGKTFVDYYASNDWYNKNNKKVRSWKATLERVWCRDENKLEPVDGAPKGFEYFFIESEDGERISPEGWRDGKPTHSNFIYAELLLEEYIKCT